MVSAVVEPTWRVSVPELYVQAMLSTDRTMLPELKLFVSDAESVSVVP